MPTCCPDFRSALIHARRSYNRTALNHFEGYATATEVFDAHARLVAFEGAADPLTAHEVAARYSLALRAARRRRSRSSR